MAIRLLPLLILGFVLVYYRGFFAFRKSKIDTLTMHEIYQTTKEHNLNCRQEDKSKCLVVYIAPWCSACKEFLTELFPIMLTRLEKYPQIGLEVIVGADKESALKNLALAVGRPCLLDPKKNLFKKLGLRAFPSFIGLKKNGKVIHTASGFRTQGSTAEEAMDHFIENLTSENIIH